MGESIADLLGRKGLKLGHYVTEFTTPGIGYILKEAGAEFAFFDMEHSGHGYETLNRCLRYFEAARLPTFVRVPSDNYHHIARGVDAGAEAIVVPMIGSAEQALAIVECMKFTPKGRRGLAPGLANDLYHMGPVKEGLAAANAKTRFVALIESVDGIANVDEIAAVDGVDALWVGHLDLTAGMGIPGEFEHPDYLKALDKTLKAGKRHNKGLGRTTADVASAIAVAAEGWDLVLYHGDAWLLQIALRQGIEGIREGLAKMPKRAASKPKKPKGKRGKSEDKL